MRDIQIGGLVSFTTIDYPGKLAAVLFLVGCPLRCAYCSNPHLLDVRDGDYDPDKVFDWIAQRVGKLEAIVFSGGEALMQGPALIEYMRRVRELGFKIGLHTNGFYPENLKLAAPYVDWIGLDYKATRNKYQSLVGNNIAYDRMIESLIFWQSTGKDFEVRITCDPRFIDIADLNEIVDDCATRRVKTIAIQKYIPHFENADVATTAAQREQFFADSALRAKIDSMFESVTWRE
ncbi:MAG: anaerobic ribonucleoside-triphosphate reductase activating protein [Alphaproteobacteria bacterium]|nr:anaerobic ribonucleoside-triphosphate reductase activating protein [Alphaproteobacteria bacterium]